MNGSLISDELLQAIRRTVREVSVMEGTRKRSGKKPPRSAGGGVAVSAPESFSQNLAVVVNVVGGSTDEFDWDASKPFFRMTFFSGKVVRLKFSPDPGAVQTMEFDSSQALDANLITVRNMSPSTLVPGTVVRIYGTGLKPDTFYQSQSLPLPLPLVEPIAAGFEVRGWGGYPGPGTETTKTRVLYHDGEHTDTPKWGGENC